MPKLNWLCEQRLIQYVENLAWILLASNLQGILCKSLGNASVAIISHITEIFIHCGAIPVICVLMVEQRGSH